MMQLSAAGCLPDPRGMNRVHIDVLPAMTGVSRFGEPADASWTFSKEEKLTDVQLVARGFTHLISARDQIPRFTQRLAVDGFDRIRLHKGLPPLQVVTKPQVWIHCAARR